MTEVASILFAAGKGTRMTGYCGNKTLLPLVAGKSPFEGTRPMIREVLDNLPAGPKGIVLHHCGEQVRKATEGPGISYIVQPETNGTGGALLAARPFLESAPVDRVIVTMGDVPLIRSVTYGKLLERLTSCDMALLAFEPADKARYGMLKLDGERVSEIVEWDCWRKYGAENRGKLRYCNAGVYAAGRKTLLEYAARLESRPHVVQKERDGKPASVREYFLTDLAEMMYADGLFVGMVPAPEEEVRGVDTPEALAVAQELFAKRFAGFR